MNFCFMEFNALSGKAYFVWREKWLYRIFLSSPEISSKSRMRKEYRNAVENSSLFAKEIALILNDLAAGISREIPGGILNYGDVSAFRMGVLSTLAKVKRGETVSYGELAERAGFPGAARAAGSVLASNPFPLVIPCHRVVKSDGSIGSYQGGTAFKRFLLEAEIV